MVSNPYIFSLTSLKHNCNSDANKRPQEFFIRKENNKYKLYNLWFFWLQEKVLSETPQWCLMKRNMRCPKIRVVVKINNSTDLKINTSAITKKYATLRLPTQMQTKFVLCSFLYTSLS